MKQSKILLGVALGLMAIVHSAWLSAGAESAVLVLRLNDVAQSLSGTDPPQPLRVGDVLEPGATIRTGGRKDGFVDLVFDADAAACRDLAARSAALAEPAVSASGFGTERSVLRLWPGTVLKLIGARSIDTGAGTVTEATLELEHGRISGILNKLSAASLFEIRLPGGAVALKGGAFDISGDGSVIETTGSPIKLAWSDPKTGSSLAHWIEADKRYDFRNSQVTPLSTLELAGLSRTAKAMSFVESRPKSRAASEARDHTKRPITPPGPPFPPPGPPPTKPPVQPPGPPVTPPRTAGVR